MFFSCCFPKRSEPVHPVDSDTVNLENRTEDFGISSKPDEVGTARSKSGAVVHPVEENNSCANIGILSMLDKSESTQSKTVREFDGEPFGEDEDEEEMLNKVFRLLPKNENGRISLPGLNEALSDRQLNHYAELIQVLKLQIEQDSCADLDYTKFKEAADKIPHGRGHRVQWAKTLGLEGLLARRLKIGDFFDGLAGVRSMSREEIRTACAQVCEDLPVLVERCWEKLQQTQILSSPEEANAKFCTSQGAFTGKFASLDLFYQGPEGLIGAPNPNLFEGMWREHCKRPNSRTAFTTPNYNFTTCSDWEWRFVVCPDEVPEKGFQYPHTPVVRDRSEWNGRDTAQGGPWKGNGRSAVPLPQLMALPPVHAAGLRQEEVIALRLYTGPLYVLYNAVLRDFPPHIVEGLGGNRYETTIFCLCSGITKLSKVTPVPAGRLLYRGLGGMLLPEQFWRGDGPGGFRGGVEYGLMSTTASRATAIQYSGLDKRRATIFEIQAGRIDVGASLGFLSQYPGEEEFLMQPLSCLEVVGRPRVEATAAGEVVVFPLRVNVNLKSVTVEELTQRRKRLHLAMLKNLLEEFELAVRADIEECPDQPAGAGAAPPPRTPDLELRGGVADGAAQPALEGAGVRALLSDALGRVAAELGRLAERHRALDAESFNRDEEYKARTMEAIDAKALALRKMAMFRAEAAGPAERDAGLLRRILETPLDEFRRPGVGLRVRTGVAGFPWDEVADGRPALDLGAWTPHGVDARLLGSVRRALAAAGGAVRSVAAGGRVLVFADGLLAPEVRLDHQPAAGATAAPLAFLLSANTGLEALSLRGCGLGGHDWAAVVEALGDRAPLTRINDLRLDAAGVLSGRAAGLDLAGRPLDLDAGFVVAGLLRRAGATLVTLELSGCGLPPAAGAALAHGLARAAVLERLGLGSNRLGSEGGAALAKGLGRASALRDLSLRDNALDYGAWGHVLGALGACSCLTALNDAGWLAGLIAGGLETLALPAAGGGGSLGVDEVAAVGFLLPRSAATLTSLSLAAEELGPEGCAALAKGLSALTALTELTLADEQGLDVDDWSGILGALRGATALRRLNGRDVPALAGGLASLGLVGKRLSDEDAAILGTFLPRSAATLTSVDVSRNPRLGDGGCGALAEGLRGAPLLQNLSLAKVGMGPLGATAVADVLGHLSALQSLNLGSNEIQQEGLAAVVTALYKLPALQRFELAGAGAGAGGATALADWLGRGPPLRVLTFSSNSLGAEGCAAIAGCLGALSVLCDLELSSNEIDSATASVLAERLTCVTTLEALGLCENPLGADGIRSIVGALQQLPALHTLSLGDTNASDEGLKCICEAMPHIARLRSLDLDGSGATLASWRQLLGVLDRCTSLTSLNNYDWSAGLIAGGVTSVKLSGSKGIGWAAVAGWYLVRAAETLTDVDMSSIKLNATQTAVVAEGLKKLTALRRLDASCNALGDAGLAVILDALRPLSCLEALDLSRNGASHKSACAIADLVKAKPFLTQLSLHTNPALGIEGWALIADALSRSCQLLDEVNGDSWSRSLIPGNLTVVDIVSAGVDSESVVVLTSLLARSASVLTVLNLRGNDIGSEGAKALARGLPSLALLVELKLSDCNLGKDGVAAIAEVLHRLPSLRLLDFEGNSIEDQGAALIAIGLGRCSALEHLWLGNNDLKWGGWGQISAALSECCHLRTVNGLSWSGEGLLKGQQTTIALQNREIDAEGAALIGGFLSRSAASLTALDLSRNEMGDEGGSALAAGLRSATVLKELLLAECGFNDDGITAIAASLAVLTGLRVLSLRSNNISEEGVLAVVQALRTMALSFLVTLDLGGGGDNSSLSDEGGAALAEALAFAPALQTLDLSGISLDEAAAVSLAEGLAGLSGLLNLLLSGCEAGEEFASVLAECLQHVPGLEALDLGSNCLGDNGSTKLAKGLGQAQRLRRLVLNENEIGAAGARSVADNLLRVKELRELNLNGQGLGSGLEAVMSKLSTAPGLVVLSLSGVEIDEAAAVMLADMLRRGLASAMEALDLSDNEVGCAGGTALAACFPGVPGLQSLRLDRCCLGKDGVAAVGSQLCRLTCLSELFLEENDAGAAGATSIAQGLMQVTALKALGFASNDVGADGSACLGSAIANLPVLSTLDLGGTGTDEACATAVAQGLTKGIVTALTSLKIGSAESEGWAAIFLSLQGCKGLRELNGLMWTRGLLAGQTTSLDLSDSEPCISEEGCAWILAGLLRWPGTVAALRTINLESGGLKEEEAAAIVEALVAGGATSLTSLNLKKNVLGEKGGAALAQALNMLSALRELDVSEAQLGDAGCSALTAGLCGAQRLEILKWSDSGAEEGTVAAARASLAATRGLPAVIRAEKQHRHPLIFAFEREGCACDNCGASSEAFGLSYVCEKCNHDLCLKCASRFGKAADSSEADSESEESDSEDEDDEEEDEQENGEEDSEEEEGDGGENEDEEDGSGGDGD